MFLYHDNVHGLWNSLTWMYSDEQSGSWIFELHWEIARASQATLDISIVDFFGYLQSRWEELAQYEPLSEFPVETTSFVAKHLNRQYAYQFIMSLKPDFESFWTYILNSSLMPTLYEAFAMIDGDECRRRLI